MAVHAALSSSERLAESGSGARSARSRSRCLRFAALLYFLRSSRLIVATDICPPIETTQRWATTPGGTGEVPRKRLINFAVPAQTVASGRHGRRRRAG